MGKTSRKSPPSILFVEDDLFLRRDVTDYLRHAFPQARIGSARSSREAINKFQKSPFDVLVIDIQLTKDTVALGLDVVRPLKKLDVYPFRSIAYSEHAKEYGYEAWKAGFDALVEKHKIEELTKEIHHQFEFVEKHSSPPKGNVFCIMPFGEQSYDVYLFGIKNAAQEAGFTCERNDEHFFTTDILEEIRKNIKEADLIVADLTGSNANVYYEVGYAHALGKDVVLIAQSEKDLKFDLQNMPSIIYRGSILTLRAKLKETLLELGNQKRFPEIAPELAGDENYRAYLAHKKQLEKNHMNQYVAFVDRKPVAFSDEMSELHKRLDEAHGGKTAFIKKITSTERVIAFRRPKRVKRP